MGKQGTLHPRKHPCSSAGVVPEHTHKQTDSDTHRQIQTHTETHTPNGCFPSKGTHLLPLYSPASQTQFETEATPLSSPLAVEGMDFGSHNLVPSHSTISEVGYHARSPSPTVENRMSTLGGGGAS